MRNGENERLRAEAMQLLEEVEQLRTDTMADQRK
jgi:hypothetical protein